MTFLRGTRTALLLFAMSWAAAGAASGETYPARNIKVLVPFAAAGVQDIVTRIVFDKVSAALGQPIIIDNRPGAGGTLALAAVATAPPDGYTLVVSDPRGSLAAAPSLYPNLGYDPRTSFEPIALVGRSGAVLSVGKDFSAKNLSELVQMARKRPGELTFGSTGNGTPGHLNGELFKRQVGIDVVHVPYRLVSQAVTDLMAARISFWISPLATVLPQLSGGELRALAVAGKSRLPEIPDVPTIEESGFGLYDASTAYAFFAPTGTPTTVIDILAKQIKNAIQEPDVRQRLLKAGVSPEFGSSKDVKDIVSQRVSIWSNLISSAGITIGGR